MNLTTVLIGIQARSTSTRLPGKCFELIGEKRLLDHVLDACNGAAGYMNRYVEKTGILVRVALLIPVGDRIDQEFRSRTTIIQGPEHDVLTRYKTAGDKFDADYIVRVTGDCPMIPPYIISKHIKIATVNKYDYVSNSDETTRTALDGIDCEVISRKMLDHLQTEAVDKLDREHVTTYARRSPPKWAKMGCIIGFFNHSDIKLSVDTKEDLERVRTHYNSLDLKIKNWERRYGKQSIHRV